MKTQTLRSFKSVHTWVGLFSGMFLFIAFYAGAITMFFGTLNSWEAERHTAQRTTIQADGVLLFEQFMRKHGDEVSRLSLRFPEQAAEQAKIFWFSRKEGQTKGRKVSYLDEDGVMVDKDNHQNASRFTYDLHFTAGIPKPIGTYLFGLVCVLYGLALVSGVVIYLPTFIKDLFALRVGKNIKRMWQDAHNVVGILSLPFHVIFAWSGAVLTIGTLLLAPMQFLVYEGKLLNMVQNDLGGSPRIKAAGKQAPMLPVAELLQQAKQKLPEAKLTFLTFSNVNDEHATVMVRGIVEQGTLIKRASVVMNAVDGSIIKVAQPTTATPGTTFLRGLTALHFGDYGQVPLRWLYFVLGMMGAFLFYSGNLLWIESRRKRRKHEQPGKTWWMARLTIGVCIGSMAAISFMFVMQKIAPIQTPKLYYFASWLVCIFWACIRAPAHSACELLLLAAACTVLVPLADTIATQRTLVHHVLAGEWPSFAVEATAVLMAWSFWQMARATKKRSQNGDEHSVWSLKAK